MNPRGTRNLKWAISVEPGRRTTMSSQSTATRESSYRRMRAIPPQAPRPPTRPRPPRRYPRPHHDHRKRPNSHAAANANMPATSITHMVDARSTPNRRVTSNHKKRRAGTRAHSHRRDAVGLLVGGACGPCDRTPTAHGEVPVEGADAVRGCEPVACGPTGGVGGGRRRPVGAGALRARGTAQESLMVPSVAPRPPIGSALAHKKTPDAQQHRAPSFSRVTAGTAPTRAA